MEVRLHHCERGWYLCWSFKKGRAGIYYSHMKQNASLIAWACGAIIILIAFSSVYASYQSSVLNVNAAKNALRRFPQGSTALTINGDGSVRVFGIQITSINGNEITASGTASGAPVALTLTTDAATTFHVLNATSSLSNLSVGDMVMIVGTFQGFNPNVAVAASDIRTLGLAGPALNPLLPRTLLAPIITSPSTAKISTSTKTSSTKAATTTKKK